MEGSQNKNLGAAYLPDVLVGQILNGAPVFVNAYKYIKF